MIRTLRETEIPQKLYTRNDPDSRAAYFEIEEPNVHLNVGASVGSLQFIWNRYKSNENLKNHSFTHYLTRHIYSRDEYRVLNGQKVGKDIVKIKTDDGSIGLLCAEDIDVFTNVDKDGEELPEKIVVIVRQEKLDNNHVRLISCYPTKNRTYLRWYWRNFNIRGKYGSKRPDALDKSDLPAMTEHMKEKWDEVKYIQAEVWNEVIEELVENSIIAANKFIKLVKDKTMPQWQQEAKT